MTRETGKYLRTTFGDEEVRAFVPHPLPPAEPPLDLSGALAGRLRSAEEALRRLDVAGDMVPSLDWFIYAFVRKEAVVSSQIEGTQATLVDLLSFEAEAVEVPPSADVEEVCNYLAALELARDQLASPAGLPLSLRLLNDVHRRLMTGVRGGERSPGEVRRSQNWIGGSRPGNAVYVPPPPDQLERLLGELERYLHAEDGLHPLVRTGLAHVQFETIHPYLDGNGRVGRLLITLLLEHWGLVRKPLLYLSLFFKRHRAEYYRRLDAVRTDGDWEAWLDFFLDGVATIAEEAVATARDLFGLVSEDRGRLLADARTSLATVRLFETLPRRPVVTVASAMRAASVTRPTASKAIDGLVAAGVLVETTGKRRDRSFSYERYLSRLREGTDLA